MSAAAPSFSGNLKKALAGIRHIDLEGLRWRVFDAKGQDRDRKLRIFAGREHPFDDRPIKQYVPPERQVRELRPRARRAMIRAQMKAEQQQAHDQQQVQGDSNARKGKKRQEVEEQELSNLDNCQREPYMMHDSSLPVNTI